MLDHKNKACGSKVDHVATHNDELLLSNQGSKVDHDWTQQTSCVGNPNLGSNKACGSKVDHVATHNDESLLSNQGSKMDHGWTQQTSCVGNPNLGSKLDQDGSLTRNCSQLDSTGYQVRAREQWI